MASDTLTRPAADPFPPLTAEQEAWIERRHGEIEAALGVAREDVEADRVAGDSIAEMVARHLTPQTHD